MRREWGLLLVAVLAGIATLASCTATLGSASARTADPAPAVDRTAASATLLANYMEVLQRLVQGAPAEQAEILAAAQRDYELAPTGSHQLRYALVLAAPGHAGTDLPHAQKLLRELLATPETLLPVERALAFLQLQTVERQLTLTAENQQLAANAERNDRDHVAAASRRLQAEMDENAKLRKELDEAHAKLEAIANIERSLNKRKPPGEGSTP